MAEESLIVRGAREHNLRNIDVTIPRDRLTVITGLSGSGKSSLAFDTIYAEGQRRYVESLSAYARQFLGLMEKPDVDAIEGLSPAIAIEQKTAGHNPRSTVGTVTEIYDYLRLLYARAGTPHCANCGRPVQRQSAGQIADTVLTWAPGTRIEVLAPLVRGRKGEFRELFESARKQGFVRAFVDGALVDLAEPPKLNRRQNHNVSVVVDRLIVRARGPGRLADSIETALRLADGLVEVVAHRRDGDGGETHLYSREVRLSGLRDLAAGARAAALLVQLAVRRVPGVQRAGHAARSVAKISSSAIRASRSSRASSCRGASPTGTCAKSSCRGSPSAIKFDLNTPWGQLSQTVREVLLYGAGGRQGVGADAGGRWDAVGGDSRARAAAPRRDHSPTRVQMELEQYMVGVPCSACGGRRLKPESLAVTIAERNIGEVVEFSVADAQQLFEGLAVRPPGRPGGSIPDIAGRFSRKCASGSGSSSMSGSTT